MKIVFVSNYYNHHQAALSRELYRLTNGQFLFVQTEEMEADRKQLGWELSLPDFVRCSYASQEIYRDCEREVIAADLVITGGNPTAEKLVQKRIKAGRLVFRYSERVYKNARAEKQKLLRGIKYHLCNFPYKNVYLLSASAYAASDYAKTGNFINKAYRWGYFPEIKRYEDIGDLVANKTPGAILWVARLIDWKHPELCLKVAKRLKTEGIPFRISMIGNGPMEEQLRRQLCQEELEDCVGLLGAMKPEQVRLHMEQASVFLFTSDFGEGWGAVLNEAMNSGCATVSSHAIGATPYLVNHGENGLVYKNGDFEDLYQNVKFLLEHPQQCAVMGEKAYKTMVNLWNAEIAAQRVVELARQILSGNRYPRICEEGPCSRAERLDNNWYE